MISRILVGLDGSPLAESALPYAAVMARATKAEVLLLRAVSAGETIEPLPRVNQHLLSNTAATPKDNTLDAAASSRRMVHEARAYLDGVAARFGQEGVPWQVLVSAGNAADVIVEEAALHDVHLIVLGTHGRSGLGRWIYGSVADEVMRRAKVPVLLVPALCERVWHENRPLRIVIPLDGSPLAEEALAAVRDLVETIGAELFLVRAVEPPRYVYGDAFLYVQSDVETELTRAKQYLDKVARALRATGQAVDVRAAMGEPAVVVADLARDWQADLIATATHGNSGLTRLVMGSVATAVVQHAHVPILIVRPTAARRPVCPATTN